MSTYKTFGAGTYSLSSSIGSTDTSINLSSFTEPVSGVVYTMALLATDIVYGTIAPGTTSSEFISFTGITNNGDGTATLTGVVRGLAKKTPFTTSATFKLPHSSQTTFIISNPPQLYEKFAVKSSDETIGGQWTFNNTPISPLGGVSDASTTVKGVSTLSVAPVSATAPIAVGTNDPRLSVNYAVDSVGTDAYAITPSPAITAYVAGQTFSFKAGVANTGAVSLNVSGLGAKTIKKNVSSDLATGDILLNQIVTVQYDGTNMQLISQLGGSRDASLLTGTLPAISGASLTGVLHSFDAYTTLAVSTPAPYDGFLVGTFVPATSGSTSESGSVSLLVDSVERAASDWSKTSGSGPNTQVTSFCVPIKASSQYTITQTAVTVNIAYIPIK